MVLMAVALALEFFFKFANPASPIESIKDIHTGSDTGALYGPFAGDLFAAHSGDKTLIYGLDGRLRFAVVIPSRQWVVPSNPNVPGIKENLELIDYDDPKNFERIRHTDFAYQHYLFSRKVDWLKQSLNASFAAIDKELYVHVARIQSVTSEERKHLIWIGSSHKDAYIEDVVYLVNPKKRRSLPLIGLRYEPMPDELSDRGRLFGQLISGSDKSSFFLSSWDTNTIYLIKIKASAIERVK
jgi:hypothetical protein